MSPKILILDEDAAAIDAALRKRCEDALDLVSAEDTSAAIARGRDVQVVLGAPLLVARALPELPAVRWVQSTWAGVRPLLPAAERDPELVVTGVKGLFGGLMAEYVLGYLIAVQRRVFEYREQQRARRWRQLEQTRLNGLRMTVLGLGDIGCTVAGAARTFGLEVYGVTRSGTSDCPHVSRVGTPEALTGIARESDVLVCILPDTPQARGTVDASVLAALPSHAVLINVGRGSSVDHDALWDALEAGRIKAAVLDVCDPEPLPSDHPLWMHPRAIITPHVAAMTLPEDIAGVFLGNLQRWRAGAPLHYRVDPVRGY